MIERLYFPGRSIEKANTREYVLPTPELVVVTRFHSLVFRIYSQD